MADASTLYDFLPRHEAPANDLLLGRFLEFVAARSLDLYPAQEQAILELFEDRSVILNTPTGSGKSLVALAMHYRSLAQGRRSVYTCPIKALVNEKWLSLCREFGAVNVGLSTGDATINHDAPILCCTAEILANMALRDGADTPFRDVVMDEFHYYSDRDRGGAWQVPLLTLSRARFLLMSATLGETEFFERDLERLTGRPAVTVKSTRRPVPLDFSYAETPLSQTVEQLLKDDRGPVYVVHFTQAEAAQSAQDFTSLNVATREEKAGVATALEGQRFTSPFGPDLKRWLRHGIGLHHAGLLPRYRILVEQLAQRGLLKVICGTDTLGVGINVPIRTVLFTRLSKYDGRKTGILSVRDFHQIAGRAGRKGFDDVGWVVAQAPEHVVENLKLEEKARRDGKKVNRRRPPDGFVAWDQNTFQRLIAAPPERLESRFQVTHGMLLNVLGRPGDGCDAMRTLIRVSHEPPSRKKAHRSRAWQLFRALVDRRIIELVPRTPDGRHLRVNLDLQEDFSLDQTLSLYLLDTLPLLDPGAADYPMDVLTLVEAILEDPDLILRRQLDRVKTRKLAEWKAEGMEYQQRMDELDRLEYPKPRREFVYETFNAFAEKHPWVGQENIRPKSIAREMFEEFRTFSDYVRRYELQRVEGLLLRHLSSVLKVLRQTVPDRFKTPPVREVEEYLGLMIRQVDSSLLDEWERLRHPDQAPGPAAGPAPEIRPPGAEAAAADVTRDAEAFTAAIRARVFAFLRAVADDDPGAALEGVDGVEVAADGEDGGWTPARLSEAWSAYCAGHARLSLDPEARNRRHTYVKPAEDGSRWTVEQVLVDPEGLNDWSAVFRVDLAASRTAGKPVLHFVRLAVVGPGAG